MDKTSKPTGLQEAAQHGAERIVVPPSLAEFGAIDELVNEVAALTRQLDSEHEIRRGAHDRLDRAGVRHGPIDARVANVIAKMNEYRQRLADGVAAEDLDEDQKRAEYVAHIERELRPASFSDEQWSCAWEYAQDITSDEDGDSILFDVEKALSCFVSLMRRLGYVPYDPPNFIE